MLDKLNNFLDGIFTNIFDKYMPITFATFLIFFSSAIIYAVIKG